MLTSEYPYAHGQLESGEYYVKKNGFSFAFKTAVFYTVKMFLKEVEFECMYYNGSRICAYCILEGFINLLYIYNFCICYLLAFFPE